MACAERAIEYAVEKLGQLLIDEIIFLNEVRADVYWMQSELRWMMGFLEDADAKGKNGDKRTEIWIREVTTVANEAEDVVDTFMLQIESKNRQKMRFFYRHTCIPSNLIDLHYIGTEILQIKSRIHMISERKERYGINNLGESSFSINKNFQAQRNINPYLLKNKFFVGFGGQKKLILGRLIDPKARKRVVVPIVGMGGLGKTTLATMVYNSDVVKDWFECHAWVTVSEEFKPLELLHNLSKQIGGNSEKCSNMDEVELKAQVHDCLKKQRYLIVLDDIWEQDPNVWQQLKDVFPDVENGSRILITTRFIGVGKYVDPSNEPYLLPFLGHEDGWRLFLNIVFPSNDGSEPKCPESLEILGKDLIRKCGGLPLGVIVLGGILSVTDHTITTWNRVADKWKYQDSNLRVLALSHNHLPNVNMKSCFLYIGNYPEDYIIKASQLTKFWIAEGFIPKEGNQTYEETAKDYLDEFVLRCMVQVVDRTQTSKRVKHFRIHDLFRKWCILEAQEDGFFRICTSNSDMSSPEIIAARRLTIYNSKLDDKFYDLSFKARAILGFDYLSLDNFLLSNIGQNFKLLRVIYLKFPENVNIHKSRLLKGISRLIHLRNITFISKALTYLPSSIGNLHNLQTLNIKNTSIFKLPAAFYKITGLRHLYARGIAIQSSISWKCRSLQTLDSISGGNWFLKNLTKFSNLRKLSISGITQIEVKGFQDSLHRLDHLKSLCLESDGQTDPYLFSSFKNDSPLSKLVLINFNNVSSIFPQNLISVKLSGCTFQKGVIASLEKLQGLVNLSLEDCDIHSEDEFIFSANGFLQLESLRIGEMRSLLDWRISNEALPKIKYLMVRATNWLHMLPNGLEFLKSLEKLEMEFKNNLIIQQRLLKTFDDRYKIPQTTYVTLDGIQLNQHIRSSDTTRADETSVSNDESILSPKYDEPVLSAQDDVTILSSEDESGETIISFRNGRTRQTVTQKKEAPLGAIKYKVMLQVMGMDPNKDRPGVDIVALIGGGLNGIERMKPAIKFLIKKLNPIDRLSIISFSGTWQLLCPLRQLTENSLVELEKLVNALSIGENVDMNAGLKMGLQVLNERRFTTGRKAAIFLMVDRNAWNDTNATRPSMNVPVHAFTFGMQCSQKLVREISEGSMGEEFSHIRHSDSFNVAFSRCLAKLITVALPDLKLSVRQIESTIKSVNAGKYPQSTEPDGSITVSFGDLYVNQFCKILVDFHLPAVRSPRMEDVARFTFSYSADEIELTPHICTVLRSETCGWD